MIIYTYKTKGTCASHIQLELDGDVLRKVKFIKSCDGNSQGIARLVEGLTVEEIKQKLSGIKCGGKCTSCPDQLAKAVDEAYWARNSKVASET